jgi:hypothetical protein
VQAGAVRQADVDVPAGGSAAHRVRDGSGGLDDLESHWAGDGDFDAYFVTGEQEGSGCDEGDAYYAYRTVQAPW